MALAQDVTMPLRRLSEAGPLRVGVLVSATGGNLRTLLAIRAREPQLLDVCLVASQGTTAPALTVARSHGVETWTGDFDAACGFASAARTAEQRAVYRHHARCWHDHLDERISAWEAANAPLDLLVLAYHRWVEGNLLERFRGRIVNQHPGDLAKLSASGERLLVGRDPVASAVRLGHPATRTSCFLVDGGHDTGAILCQGPPVPVADGKRTDAGRHELIQKVVSDRPCLEWTVRALAAGRLAVSGARHADGSPVVLVDGRPTELGGWRLRS